MLDFLSLVDDFPADGGHSNGHLICYSPLFPLCETIFSTAITENIKKVSLNRYFNLRYIDDVPSLNIARISDCFHLILPIDFTCFIDTVIKENLVDWLVACWVLN